jgi:CBS domain-containing protein
MRWTVSELMTSPVVTVSGTTDFKTIAQTLRAYNIGSVPVVDGGDRLVGIVSEDDLIAKIGWTADHHNAVDRWFLADELEKAAGGTAAEVMTRTVVTVDPNAKIEMVARLMRLHHLKAIPVVREGRLVGIVSRADLLKAYVRDDREIRNDVIADVLKHRLWIGDDEVEVTVESGSVGLRGRVESRSLAQIAEHLVEALPGVVEVDNQLTWAVDDRHPRLVHEPQDDLTYTGPPLRQR